MKAVSTPFIRARKPARLQSIRFALPVSGTRQAVQTRSADPPISEQRAVGSHR